MDWTTFSASVATSIVGSAALSVVIKSRLDYLAKKRQSRRVVDAGTAKRILEVFSYDHFRSDHYGGTIIQTVVQDSALRPLHRLSYLGRHDDFAFIDPTINKRWNEVVESASRLSLHMLHNRYQLDGDTAEEPRYTYDKSLSERDLSTVRGKGYELSSQFDRAFRDWYRSVKENLGEFMLEESKNG